jgi:DNA-binding response OmpR family regulator
MKDVFEGAAILLVEDDNDIRDLLVTLLKLAGFSPTACASAEQGLEELREQPFDLVLTDYALPNRSGGWLLQQARDEGLLDATPALVVTAHPNPPDLPGFEIIQKPFDLDQLVERVRQRLEAGSSPRPRQVRVTRSNGGASDDGGADCPDPVELILYVSAHSARSATAIKNIRRALEGQRAGRVTLTICDLSKDPSLGQRDAVAFTPTLVKRSPGPRTFILGHITSPELVLELLDGCEEES